MKTATIDELAYLIKEANENNMPKPIVFLGAGASKTGNIPLAKDIVDDILGAYKDNPKIKALKDAEKTYPKLMECLTPNERNKLLKGYIDKAKINVTHIFLAQFLKLGYIDYVLTVNFDNLMLRALALFNEFPPTYDMAILTDLTTTSFKVGSVVYLHGQHHGLWLLNTEEEMARVKDTVLRIFDSIKNERLWIFIGYSGQDPIFDYIERLGRFDNGLYWVGYEKQTPDEAVCRKLLDKKNSNSYLIQDYDADSFVLTLSNQLNLDHPSIIAQPFTALKESLENIVDIADKEPFKGVKTRLENRKNHVAKAISLFETREVEINEFSQEEVNISFLRNQVSEFSAKGDFDEIKINKMLAQAEQLNNQELNIELANMFNNWGLQIFKSAKLKNDDELYQKSGEKYQQATLLNPQEPNAFYNWGLVFYERAKLNNDQTFYQKSFEQYDKATKLNHQDVDAFYNWGLALYHLAKLTDDPALYEQSIDKNRLVTEMSPLNANAFNNWGLAIYELASLKNAPELYEQSIEQYRKATELDSSYAGGFYNWGLAIEQLAKLKNDPALYHQSIEKYRQVTLLNPQDAEAFTNWGNAIIALVKFHQGKDREKYLNEAIEVIKQAVDLGGERYNLACVYALKNDKAKAFEILESCLKEKTVAPDFVQADEDWQIYQADPDFIKLIEKYK